MIAAVRLVALLGIGAWLTLSRLLAAGGEAAAPTGAAGHADAGVSGAAPGAGAAPAAPAAGRLSSEACDQLRQRVEGQLKAAAKGCKTDDACEATTFDYAFRPCGLSVRTGASLTKAAADAKQYRERCNPVIRPVRCAYTPVPKCDQGRCTLAAPASK